MASLWGTNKIIFSQDIEALNGIRVEGFLNLCGHYTAEIGHPVYHGGLEIIDGRGGIDVSIQILPIVNPKDTSHMGHFDDDDFASATIKEQVTFVVGRLIHASTDTERTKGDLIRSLYITAIEMEIEQNKSLSMFGADSLLSLLGIEDDYEDNEDNDISDGGLFGRNINPLAGLLGD